MNDSKRKIKNWLEANSLNVWRTIGISFPAIILTYLCYCCAARMAEPDFYLTEELSPGIYIVKFPDCSYATYNKVSDKIVSPRVKYIGSARTDDSLIVFSDENGRRGYLSTLTGEVAIEAQYRNAYVFSEGLGAVVDDSDRLYFINRKNEIVIDKGFDYTSRAEYRFVGGYCIMAVKRNEEFLEYGVIDRKGEWILPQIYAEIERMNETFYHKIGVRKGENTIYGMTDARFNWIYTPEYGNISLFDDRESVFLTENFIKRQQAFDGTIIETFVLDSVEELEFMLPGRKEYDEDGCEIDRSCISDTYARFRVDDRWGIINRKTGEVLLAAMYHDVQLVSEHIALAQIDNTGESLAFNLQTGKKINYRR